MVKIKVDNSDRVLNFHINCKNSNNSCFEGYSYLSKGWDVSHNYGKYEFEDGSFLYPLKTENKNVIIWMWKKTDQKFSVGYREDTTEFGDFEEPVLVSVANSISDELGQVYYIES
jgi:hypothetical protein